MKVLVTGGTGFVGSHLVEKLLAKQYQVYCICRNTSNRQYLKSLPQAGNLRFISMDISDRSSYSALTDILKDIDYIYHIAGLIKAYQAEDYDRANSRATKYLIEAVAEIHNKNLKRFLYLSSLAAAGPSENITGIDENHPCHPVSHYGQSKLKGEFALNRYNGFIPITILRPPPVYGPRDSGLLVFFQALSHGIKPQFSPKKYISLIYVKDLVEAIILSAEATGTIGQTYFTANKDCYPINSIIKTIGHIVNDKAVTVKLSDGLIKAITGFYESLCYALGLNPSMINNQKVLELSQKYWTCQTEKIRMAIGFAASTPVEKGLRETADWYLQNKWIKK